MKKIIGWFILLSMVPLIFCLPVYFDKPLEGLPHFMSSWNPYLQALVWGYMVEAFALFVVGFMCLVTTNFLDL